MAVDQSALKVLLLQLGCPKRLFRAFLFVERILTWQSAS